MGQSDRQKKADINQQSIDDLLRQIQGINPNTDNRFDKFQFPFDYSAKKKNLDELRKLGLEDINRTSENAIADNSKNTAGRLASEGITGGSIVDESIKRGQKDIFKGKFNAIRDLQKNTEAQDIGLMTQENRDKFGLTGAAQNVDFRNIFNLFRKYGLLGNTQRLSLANLQNYSGSNTWDDIFQGLNTGANIAGAFDGFGLFKSSSDSGSGNN